VNIAYRRRVATLSFLFVDQVGSTVQLEALGDAGTSPIRDELFQILRAAVDDHEGTVVDHTGDGLMASFTGATDALGCAVAIQREVHRHWASRAARRW
jgi:adenylate cyclase